MASLVKIHPKRKKTDADKKAADEKELADDKRSRASFCLAFVSGSGLLEDGQKPSDDDLVASAGDWPDGVQYVPGKSLLFPGECCDISDST